GRARPADRRGARARRLRRPDHRRPRHRGGRRPRPAPRRTAVAAARRGDRRGRPARRPADAGGPGHDGGDTDPRQVAGQVGDGAARRARRRRPDHLPARLRARADRLRGDLRLLRGARLLLGDAELAWQAPGRLRRGHLRRPRPRAPQPAPPRGDAARAGDVGPVG
ncbi:MAG: putative membrane protein, partial [uncultured Nocardioides sp.]